MLKTISRESSLSKCEISPSIYRSSVARTVEAVEALRKVWKATTSRIDADIDFFLEFMRAHSDFVLRPHVVVLSKESLVVAILPGRLERQSLKVRVGYKEIALPTEYCQITFVGQLLGEDSKEAITEVMKSIQASLRQKEADVVFFHQVDSQESLLDTVEKVGGVLTRDYFKESEENWRTKIPGTYEAFLKCRSSNTRYNIRRYSKRLLEAFPGKVQHKVFRDTSDIQLILRDCETVAAKSYHRGLGVGFVDNEATRQFFLQAAIQGWLRSYVLYVDGRATAFWNGLLYRRTLLIWNTAFDAELSELRPGLYLLQRLVEDLCADGGVRELDFGTGSAQYKRDMCDSSRLSVSKLLFAPTLKGVCVNALRSPPLAFSQAAKWILTRSGLFEKARKRWRSRLAATASVEASQKVIPVAGGRNDG